MAQSACGDLHANYGPFDYRTERSNKLGIVDRFHFTPQVEALVRGQSGSIGGDLSYTLRAFPNHHRALQAVMRYGQKLNSPQPPDTEYSIDCYFQRALRFQPSDTVARLMYANYLTIHARPSEAQQQIEQVGKLANDNAFTHYNMGLAYLDLKNYQEALSQAHKAIALGFTQSALRDKLTAAGQWREPVASPKPMQAPAANE